ncbi:MAG TPA: DUF1579 family protein [Steroidobacteraceae bacterium]|nr:DUF1579 family protein [Steroidobacteraceae bacterium]
MKSCSSIALAAISFALFTSAGAQDGKPMTGEQVLKSLIGKWEGNCRTWFVPDKIEDESKVTGEFASVLDGGYVRHVYTGSMHGKPRRGEELLVFNAATKTFQASWIDSFHTRTMILFSEGAGTARGFSVRGDYSVGEKEPKWGWRTEYTLVDEDHLTITSYNIIPKGSKYPAADYKAIEVTYQRVKGAT